MTYFTCQGGPASSPRCFPEATPPGAGRPGGACYVTTLVELQPGPGRRGGPHQEGRAGWHLCSGGTPGGRRDSGDDTQDQPEALGAGDPRPAQTCGPSREGLRAVEARVSKAPSPTHLGLHPFLTSQLRWSLVSTLGATASQHLESESEKKEVRVFAAQSCWPFTTDPGDCSPPGSSVHGILQARVREWVAIPFSREYSRPRD